MADLAGSLASASSAASTASLASDVKSLDNLRMQAKTDPDKALKQAAIQFEALFMQMLLKSMRDATPKYDTTASDAGRMYTGMLDQQLSQTLSSQTQSGKGLGLADIMMKQLSRSNPPGEGARDALRGTTQTPAAGLEKIERATTSARGHATAPQAFVDTMLPHAREAGEATGVPARFILGQAALESGWGKSEIRGPNGAQSFNLFGIKAGANWTGRTGSGFLKPARASRSPDWRASGISPVWPFSSWRSGCSCLCKRRSGHRHFQLRHQKRPRP